MIIIIIINFLEGRTWGYIRGAKYKYYILICNVAVWTTTTKYEYNTINCQHTRASHRHMNVDNTTVTLKVYVTDVLTDLNPSCRPRSNLLEIKQPSKNKLYLLKIPSFFLTCMFHTWHAVLNKHKHPGKL